jgi:CHAT domain-containing protein/Tfp pilus assembly protein PilF
MSRHLAAGVTAGLAVLAAVSVIRAQPVPLSPAAARYEQESKAAALLQRAEQLARQGQPRQAIQHCRQALAILENPSPSAEDRAGFLAVAVCLHHLGTLLLEQQEYAQARPSLERSLAILEKHYPQGDVRLAMSLSSLGHVLGKEGSPEKGRAYLERALALFEKSYPQERLQRATCLYRLGSLFLEEEQPAQAQPYLERCLALLDKADPASALNVAAILHNLSFALGQQGDFARARAYQERSVALSRKLQPRSQRGLAVGLGQLGQLCGEQGEFTAARRYCAEALALFRKLYPEAEHPRGHPDLVICLQVFSRVLYREARYEAALPLAREAVALCERLYPPAEHPHGHALLVKSLNSLGLILEALREFDEARACDERALDLAQKLYPRQRYPQGHPSVASSLSNLGLLHWFRGEPARALPYFQKCLAMERSFFPRDLYPLGHPELATALTNVAHAYYSLGEPARALPYAQQAVAMEEGLARAFAEQAAEAETLNFLARRPGATHLLLMLARELDLPGEEVYPLVWQSKAALMRILSRRQQALARDPDPQTRALGEALRATRRDLAHLLLTPAAPDRSCQDMLRRLASRKEALERQLAQRRPARPEASHERRPGPADLAKCLPPKAVFIDLCCYYRHGRGSESAREEETRTGYDYVAFVIRPGRLVRRVELGPAVPIEKAVSAWRRALTEGQDAAAPAAALRRLVWAPLAEHLPAGTTTVYLSPDEALTRLAWAALPGSRPGTVLLEDHALAVVPHGPFLLEGLTDAARSGRRLPEQGQLLAVGQVDYDRRPDAPAAPPRGAAVLGGAVPADTQRPWPPLPKTQAELNQVLALAGPRLSRPLRGTQACTARVQEELPKARWAHLATHGFFANARFRSIMQLEKKAFARDLGGERVSVGARSPLVLSGLVLAGANVSVQEPAREDASILTAETIAGLNLDGLDLAVLSACETGLGEVAGGEGAFGLQRAFHLAGARNVVASLWQVDDEATAALMGLFYHQLWVQKRPPLEALRQAQLTLYRHPERIGQLAWARGPDFVKAARLPAASGAASARRAPARLWAGFVLSGAGR